MIPQELFELKLEQKRKEDVSQVERLVRIETRLEMLVGNGQEGLCAMRGKQLSLLSGEVVKNKVQLYAIGGGLVVINSLLMVLGPHVVRAIWG